MNKEDWKTQVRKTNWVKGKKMGKKELGEMAKAMMTLEQFAQKKDNFKQKSEPVSIKTLTSGIGK